MKKQARSFSRGTFAYKAEFLQREVHCLRHSLQSNEKGEGEHSQQSENSREPPVCPKTQTRFRHCFIGTESEQRGAENLQKPTLQREQAEPNKT